MAIRKYFNACRRKVVRSYYMYCTKYFEISLAYQTSFKPIRKCIYKCNANMHLLLVKN